MDSKAKEALKRKLADSNHHFSELELQGIINREFFDDSTDADMNLIDLAAKRLALIKGISDAEQFKITAYAAFREFLDSRK